MSLHNPYHIATMGQNSRNTFTLASNGILVDVYIEDLPPIIIPIDKGGSGIIPGQEWPPVEEEKKITRKKITVTATIAGKDYKESIIVEDMPNLNIDNIKVDITDSDIKPKITIKITQ